MNIIKKIYDSYYKKRNSPETIAAYYKSRGVQIGERVAIYSYGIDATYGSLLDIGDDVSISSNVTILLHDASTKRYMGYTKIEKVHIGNMCFIGSGSIILPGSSIGDNCIIGAGAVVRGIVPENSVVIGNPAQVICKTDSYIKKCRERFDNDLLYKELNMDNLKKITSIGFVL